MEASDTAASAEQPKASEQDPAPEQSAGASGDRVVTGDHGMEPTTVLDGSENRPVATSAPPPASLGGIPLEADRAAGVKPGESSTLPGVQQTPEGGQATASPEEAREAIAGNSLDPAPPEAQEAEGHVNPAQEGTIT